jgi:hypothetical protein
VGDDSDVADVAQGRCAGHCKVPFGFRGLDREYPEPRAIFRRRMVVKNSGNCLTKFRGAFSRINCTAINNLLHY